MNECAGLNCGYSEATLKCTIKKKPTCNLTVLMCQLWRIRYDVAIGDWHVRYIYIYIYICIMPDCLCTDSKFIAAAACDRRSIVSGNNG